jgi:hypothetical protein
MSKKKPKLQCPPFSTPEELKALSPADQEKVDRFLW